VIMTTVFSVLKGEWVSMRKDQKRDSDYTHRYQSAQYASLSKR
jgi:hypothetical protein